MAETRYRQIYKILKTGIQQGTYAIGDYLPSEHELCKNYSITRTTARKALDELLKEGFIEKQQGKGSCVIERRKSLGLLNVKGFSEAVGQNVQTVFLQRPKLSKWPNELPFPISVHELDSECIYFERIRRVGGEPVMLESNWFSATVPNGILEIEFVQGSFFKTLSQIYQIEITGSSQELKALYADDNTASLLHIEKGAPILSICIKFITSNPKLNIYSFLLCNTEKYPIGNSYTH